MRQRKSDSGERNADRLPVACPRTAEYYEDLVAAYVPNRNLFFLMQEGYGQRL
jgi:hypothetical protein